MTREFKYLMHLAAAGARGVAAVPAPEPVDWQKICVLAKQQSVQGLLAYALKHSDPSLCPESIRSRQLRELRASAVSNVVQQSGVFQLLNDMESQGIHSVMLKGSVAASCYAAPETRISADTDVWIDPKDERKACRFLASRGFSVEPRWENGHHAVCHHPQLGCLELHVILYDEIVEEVWFNKMDGCEFVREPHRLIETSYGSCCTLGHTDHLIFLALHMVKHFIINGFSLRMMLDTALYFTTHTDEIDSCRFWDTINSLRYGAILQSILWALVRYCGFDPALLPGLSENCPDQMDMLLDDLEAGGFMGINDQNSRAEGWYEYNRQIMMKSRSKLRYTLYMFHWKRHLMLRSLFPPRKELALHYPRVLKSSLFVPFAWIHRLLFYVPKAVRRGALTNYIITDEQKLSPSAQSRVNLFRKLNML